MWVIGLIPAVFGLLLIIAFASGRSKCRTQTEAVVVRIIERTQHHRGRTIYDCTPVFTYTVNGKEYTGRADSSTSDPKKYAVGQKLTVYINDRNPEQVRSGSGIGFFIAGLVFAALGILIIVLALL